MAQSAGPQSAQVAQSSIALPAMAHQPGPSGHSDDDSTLCNKARPMSAGPHRPPQPPDFAALLPVRSHEIAATEGMLAMSIEQEKELVKTKTNVSQGAALEKDTSGGEEPLGEDELEYPGDFNSTRAWLVVLGAWLYAASSISYGMGAGVLIQELKLHVHPDVPIGTLSLVFGLNNFFGNFVAFFAGRLGDVIGYRPVMAGGSIIWCLAMLLSAFSYRSLGGLFFVSGALAGTGIGAAFPLYFSLISMWFKKKRGLATGIAVGGSGIGAAFLAVVLRIMLPRIGYRNTMLVWAGMIAVCQTAAFFLVKIRLAPLKPGESRVDKNWLPRGVWRDGAWYSLLISVGVGIFGYLVPFFYLITYTQEKVPDKTGLSIAVPLILSNIGSGIGRVAAGFVADRVGPLNMLIFSFVIGGVLQVGFWPNAHSYGAICAFGLMYGLIASWAVSLLPVCVAQLFGMRGLATANGFMILSNSPGTFVGPPIAGYILAAAGRNWTAVAAYGGAVMIFGGVALCWARFSREPRLFAKF